MDALQANIKAGRLKIVDPDGNVHVLNGAAKGPEASIKITDRKILRRMMVVPDLYMGEAYTDGTLTVEEGTLYDVLDFFALNLMPSLHGTGTVVLPNASKNNVVGQSKDNVAFHYDLNRALFELFLDADLQYSCAYFTDTDNTLEQAQLNKKMRVSAKALLKPGMRVLDIGSGFGGLALHMAKTFGVDVVGVTLSEEQCEVSNQRAKAAGLAHKVTFKLLDYREETAQYDRIVSVGMFEHVGQSHFDEFFQKIRDLLTDDGVCLLHSIGRMAPPGMTSPWLIKYIFPAATRHRHRRRSQPSNAPACGSRIVKFCGCTTPTRSKRGIRIFKAIATKSARFTTSGSAGYSNIICSCAKSATGA